MLTCQGEAGASRLYPIRSGRMQPHATLRFLRGHGEGVPLAVAQVQTDENL